MRNFLQFINIALQENLHKKGIYMYCRTFFSFPEFKILDIFDNPIQPRGIAEKNAWSHCSRKNCVCQNYPCKFSFFE